MRREPHPGIGEGVGEHPAEKDEEEEQEAVPSEAPADLSLLSHTGRISRLAKYRFS